MYVDYLVYLNSLTEVERNEQVIIIALVWLTMFAIAGVIELLKSKYRNKNGNSRMERILKIL